MQNPLSALKVPTLVAEITGRSSCVEPGDGSFADSFVEADLEAETHSVVATGLDVVVAPTCPAVVVPHAIYLGASDASLGKEASPDAGAALPGVSGVDSSVHDGARTALVLDMLTGQDAPDSAHETTWGDVGVYTVHSAEGLKPGTNERPARRTDISGIALEASDIEAAPTFPSAQLEGSAMPHPDIDSGQVPASDSETLGIDVTAGVNVAPSSSGDPAVVDRTDAGQSQLSDGTPRQAGFQVNPAGGTNLPGRPVEVSTRSAQDLQATGQRTQVQVRDLVGPALPMWQGKMTGETAADPTIGQPSNVSSVSGVEFGLYHPEAPEASSVMTSGQQDSVESLPQEGRSSFWERFHCGASVPTETHTRTVAAESAQPDTGVAAKTQFLSNLMRTSESVVLDPDPNDPEALAEPSRSGNKRALVVPEPANLASVSVEDVTNIDFGDLWIAAWNGRDESLEIDTDLFASQGHAASARASVGSFMSPSGFPALPVPQVAAQLAEVLVRGPGTITELALSPEELGKVRLRMEPDPANPDRMIVVINVERSETLELFRRHAGELAEAIRSAGYAEADIGFGQNGREGSSDHRKAAPSAGTLLPFDETIAFEPARMMTAGVSLDLRL